MALRPSTRRELFTGAFRARRESRRLRLDSCSPARAAAWQAHRAAPSQIDELGHLPLHLGLPHRGGPWRFVASYTAAGYRFTSPAVSVTVYKR